MVMRGFSTGVCIENPEVALLLAKLKGDHFENLWEFAQDLQRDVPVVSGNLYLGVVILLTFLGPRTQNKKHIKEKRGRAKIIARP